MGEDAKVAERNNRREAMDALKKLKNDKTISEDEFASFEKEVEKMVSDAVSQIDAVMSAKEKEIMTV
jgi:ribosome recycling factor